MQVIEWAQFLKDGLPCGEKFSSVTIGVFDGVHRGHCSLIEKIVSHNTDYVPVVITFRQNHKGEKHAQNNRVVRKLQFLNNFLKKSHFCKADFEKVKPEKNARLVRETTEFPNKSNIQTFRQKAIAFESLGVKITLVIDFTESFMRMPGIEFLEILLKHGKTGFLAVGSGFRCGYRLDTDAAAIQKFFAYHDIPVETAPEVFEGSTPVSSSRIRSAISGGDLTLAQAMLGRSYTIDLAGLPSIVLPPPGRYNVLLRKKPEETGTNAAISIEEDAVRIPENLSGSRWEFAEFLT